MQLAESLLHALKAHGAREIFGIPGDFALPFFKVIETSGILPLFTLSHEPAVGFAADAAARVNCALGVVAVTYGAGALNVVNAVAGAYAEKSPVVVISGAPGKGEAGTGLLLHHQAKTLDSQFRIFREITCDQARLDDAQRAPDEIARVLRRCLAASRPVYIEMPRDMVSATCEAVTRAPAEPVDADALAACVDEILARIAGARSPVLMVGVEVRRFDLEAKVAALAAKLRLPVVTSLMGRGLLSGTGRAADRHLSRRCRNRGHHGTGRAVGRALPARRHHLGYQLRRFGAPDRPAAHDPRARRRGDARFPHLSGHSAFGAGGRACSRERRRERRRPSPTGRPTRGICPPTMRESRRTTSPAPSTT